MSALEQVLADLEAESSELDELVASLSAEEWATVTTPEGWTVAHQIGHLLWTDETSLHAIRDPEGFLADLASLDPEVADSMVDTIAEELGSLPQADLLARWRKGRADLVEALRAVAPGEKLQWFGPPMSPASMATARMMETWAHSLDVWDGVGREKPQTDRVRNVCHIGVRTRGYVHMLRGEALPEAEVFVSLRAPSGEVWTWGPKDAAERVTGAAWDFAMLATRRRHRDDVDVQAEGAGADRWLDIVQTFAGQPGSDPLRLAERG